MITATSSPDRFGSLLRGLLKKNIPNMVYLALIGFIGIPLPYLLAMFRRWEEKGQWVYENISTADRGGLYVGIAVGTVCLLWLAGSFILALSGVGYMHNRRAVDLYHSLPVTRGQLLLSFDMLVGRLEIFPMLLLFAPSIWKRRLPSRRLVD